MSEYKLKTGKIGKAVVDGYKKMEDAFVETFLEKGEGGDGLQMKTGKVGEAVVKGYKKVEDSVVGGYKKIEGAFVDAFLEKVDGDDHEHEAGAEDGAVSENAAEGGAEGAK